MSRLAIILCFVGFFVSTANSNPLHEDLSYDSDDNLIQSASSIVNDSIKLTNDFIKELERFRTLYSGNSQFELTFPDTNITVKEHLNGIASDVILHFPKLPKEKRSQRIKNCFSKLQKYIDELHNVTDIVFDNFKKEYKNTLDQQPKDLAELKTLLLEAQNCNTFKKCNEITSRASNITEEYRDFAKQALNALVKFKDGSAISNELNKIYVSKDGHTSWKDYIFTNITTEITEKKY